MNFSLSPAAASKRERIQRSQATKDSTATRGRIHSNQRRERNCPSSASLARTVTAVSNTMNTQPAVNTTPAPTLYLQYTNGLSDLIVQIRIAAVHGSFIQPYTPGGANVHPPPIRHTVPD